ncbi:MAG: single-stranded DNA-binding protein [Desulfobulbaceae bacterium]|nr:single-stranded DNA-binding protein [Desulfobulbaceae bacterium]
MSYHKTIILGNLGRDPELRYAASGDAIASLSVAVTEKWKNKQGDLQEKTEWYRCSAFKKTAELISQYFTKGDQIMLIGRMQTRKWQDKDGADRYSTELLVDRLVFVGNRDNSSRQTQPQDAHNTAKSNGYAPSNAAPANGGFDDDIPF